VHKLHNSFLFEFDARTPIVPAHLLKILPVSGPPPENPPPKRSPLPLNAFMLHNLAHIELNAIDLAWDTLVRFSPLRAELGEQFFADFVHVADDESRHLGWVLQRMGELGCTYGDMPAHDLLWRDAQVRGGAEVSTHSLCAVGRSLGDGRILWHHASLRPAFEDTKGEG
jgi:uncharacterized ferritin-like protein (DUF455 family)